jgi:small subunit ribosomal protein S2
MSETTPEAPASPGAAVPASLPEGPKPNEPVTVRALLEAGAHFGHQTGRWDPRMKPFIFGDRNGIHILDLDQTLGRFEEALEFLRETAAAGGKVLFVGTKRQAQAPMELEARRCGQYFVNNRWLGGMLTNFRTVKKSIDRYKQLLALVEDADKVAELSKRELSRVNRQIEKYRKSLDGIREMTRLPEALFVIDVNREHIAVSEARRLGIPIVAIVDSNCSPEGIDLVIPANDDSIRAIQLYCMRVADACAEGAALHQERIVSEEAARPARTPSERSGPVLGRKVVEITQQPRRGHSADGESRGARGRGRGRKKEAPPPAEGAAPAPSEGAAPAPSEGAAPAPSEGAAPAPSEGAAPAPREGAAPAPREGAAPAPTEAPPQSEN